MATFNEVAPEPAPVAPVEEPVPGIAPWTAPDPAEPAVQPTPAVVPEQPVQPEAPVQPMPPSEPAPA